MDSSQKTARKWIPSQNLVESTAPKTPWFHISEGNLEYPVSRMIKTKAISSGNFFYRKPTLALRFNELEF